MVVIMDYVVSGYYCCLDDVKSLYTVFVPTTDRKKAEKYAESCGDELVYIKPGVYNIRWGHKEDEYIFQRMVEINNAN